MTNRTNNQKVSLIGLGQMGKKLAQLYVDAGFEVHVWNRNPAKAASMENVQVADTAETAIRESELSIICVHDNAAVLEILNTVSDKKVFADKTIVNFTTGSPAEAEELEAMINRAGGHYLNGAIQNVPDQMGQPDTAILTAGDSVVFEKFRPVLSILAGNLKYLGEKAAASPAMDLATLTCFYGAYFGLIYGAKLCQSFDLKLEEYNTIIAEVLPGMTGFFTHQLDKITHQDWAISQSPLSISVAATQRIADTLKGLPVAQEFPKVIASLLQQANSRGLAGEELAAIVKVIESPAN